MKWFNVVLFTIFMGYINLLSGQSYKVKVNIANYDYDSLYVGHYFGEKQLVKDTLLKEGKGVFTWTPDEKPKQGVYWLLMKPDMSFVEILINAEENGFEVSFDKNDTKNVKFSRSPENDLFQSYVTFLSSKRIYADSLRARMERGKAMNAKDEISENALNKLDKEVRSFQDNLMAKAPQSLTAMLIHSNFDVELPEFVGEEKDVQMKRYLFYKKHYFDHVVYNHPGLIRTPFIHRKIDDYMQKLTVQHPDSLALGIDYILDLFKDNHDVYDYYLSEFLNKYSQLKVVGHDAVYVHLVDNYYSKGKASRWVKEDNLEKMQKYADDFRPILIGKIVPNVTTYKEDGTPVQLHSSKTAYTILLIWDPECGHCKKVIPFIVDFQKKYKDKDVSVFTICNLGGEKVKKCWPAVKEKGMNAFTNTADEYGRYNQGIRVIAAPKVFILDKDKRILLKDFPGEEIDDVFGKVLEGK